ncbi:MAG: cytochrome c [Thermomicrobiales bacterium]
MFAAVLVFGYSALLDTSSDPRPVPTDTPGPVVDGGGDGDEDAAAGQAIYQAQCAACHTTDGASGVGPTWQGLFGSEVPLADGSTVTADEAYIAESVRQPAAKVHDGFQPIMPVFDLSDDEISSLIAFMQSLE